MGEHGGDAIRGGMGYGRVGQQLVAVKAELVESMDLTERSDGTDSWRPLTGSSYKVQAENQ